MNSSMALIGIVCGLAMLTAAAQGSSNVEDSQGEQSALQSDATPLNGADNRHNPYDCWPKEEIDRAIALDESYLNYLNNFAAGDQSQMIAHYRRDLASLQSAKTDVECAKKKCPAILDCKALEDERAKVIAQEALVEVLSESLEKCKAEAMGRWQECVERGLICAYGDSCAGSETLQTAGAQLE